MALLHLALKWRAASQFVAFTVDHGLRPDARDEAQMVKDRCTELGVRHHTLVWAPPNGHVSQARARDARHRLLANALRALGGSHLLFGHTLDDQYETAMIRAKTSETGLAGMRALSVSPVWPDGAGVFLGRPLLDSRRADLRHVLTDASERWVEDPSNQNRDFERVRVRQSLAEDGGEATHALHDRYIRAVRMRAQSDVRLADWLERDVDAHEDGLIVCQPTVLNAQDFAIGLGYLLLTASGSDRLAPLAPRQDLVEEILANPRKWRSRTLGGAWLAPRKGVVHIARDPGLIEVAPAQDRPTEAVRRYVWDGRFEISSEGENDAKQLKNEETVHVSALAKPSFPTFPEGHILLRCLVRERLDSLKCVLRHETCACAC